MKIKRITKPEELSINQLYLYKEWLNNRLRRGYCIKIEQDKATFQPIEVFSTDIVHFDSPDLYIAYYNAGVYCKYREMIKRHEQELKDLLEENKKNRGKARKTNIF